MVDVTVMPDFTHSAVHNVPNSVYRHVAGYTSGTADICWTVDDWAKYSNSIRIRIEQGFGPAPDVRSYDVLDIERGAWTPQSAADEVERRVQAGIQWTTLYGGDAALAAASALIVRKGPSIWVGHVDCVLANWNLDQAHASTLIGTHVHGMTCRGVQWASPSSNPHTPLPGTTLTLAEANVDLHVVQWDWAPSSQPALPPPPPPPRPVNSQKGILVTIPNGHVYDVASTDGGATWR